MNLFAVECERAGGAGGHNGPRNGEKCLRVLVPLLRKGGGDIRLGDGRLVSRRGRRFRDGLFRPARGEEQKNGEKAYGELFHNVAFLHENDGDVS